MCCKINKIVIGVFLASLCGSNCAMASTMNQKYLKQLIEQIVNQRTTKLQHKVNQLQAQVSQLKVELQHAQNTHAGLKTKSSKQTSAPVKRINHGHYTYTKVATNKRIPRSQAPKPHTRVPIKLPTMSAAHENNALTAIYLGGTPVFASPYIGEHSAFDGSNLIVNQPTINFGVNLLQQKKALEDAIIDAGHPLPHHPIIELSGEVEGIGNVQTTKPGNTKSDINLSSAELDVYAQVNPWVLAFTEFEWDDSFNGVYRVNNANAIVDSAFVTIGNLNRTPFYGTVGQLYVPFGRYSTYMISDPLTKILGRTRARTLIMGYHPQNNNGIYTSGYVFRSDTRSSAKSLAGGWNLGYEYHHGIDSVNFGGGIISNIADSQGMQRTIAPRDNPFIGFGENNRTEEIYKSVPAVDLNGKIGIGPYDLIAEYIDTTTSFDPRALTFNDHPARVSAAHFEVAYNFKFHGKPGSIAFGYGFSKQALGIFLPRRRYLAAINYSFWRDTVATLEFRHDQEYSMSDVATGAGSDPFTARHDYENLVTAQFAVFF